MTGLTLDIAQSAADIPEADWQRCAGENNPTVSHKFFVALEESGSATARTGWKPRHLVARTADGRIAGILPAYLKSHSNGEYVFDHSWADAFERAGGDYYPKLQTCVPFTPVPGPRLLLPESDAEQDAGPLLLAAAASAVENSGLSSAHATFISPEQVKLFEEAGWLIRTDQQFHWQNRGYGSFQDFLDQMASRKRKAIRKERAEAVSADIDIRCLSGDDLRPEHWDAMWRFYQDTGARKWGRPYLTRDAFDRLAQTMADQTLLVLAFREGEPIAGALNLIGQDTLYGRYWGATEHHPFLHFEVCYYQAVEWAIANGLARVEAGAQGEHKLARGYEPTPTYSAHWISHPALRRAVADFLDRERRAVAEGITYLGQFTPYRRGPLGGGGDHD